MGSAAGSDSSATAALAGLYGGPMAYMAAGQGTGGAATSTLPAPPADTPMTPPQFQTPTADPKLVAQLQSGDTATIQALMDQARSDTAALFARYGSQVAYGMGQ